MELDRETQIRILEEHFTGCLNFWKHQGMDEKSCRRKRPSGTSPGKEQPVFPTPVPYGSSNRGGSCGQNSTGKSNDVT